MLCGGLGSVEKEIQASTNLRAEELGWAGLNGERSGRRVGTTPARCVVRDNDRWAHWDWAIVDTEGG